MRRHWPFVLLALLVPILVWAYPDAADITVKDPADFYPRTSTWGIGGPSNMEVHTHVDGGDETYYPVWETSSGKYVNFLAGYTYVQCLSGAITVKFISPSYPDSVKITLDSTGSTGPKYFDCNLQVYALEVESTTQPGGISWLRIQY